jgi:hypothetical protein
LPAVPVAHYPSQSRQRQFSFGQPAYRNQLLIVLVLMVLPDAVQPVSLLRCC